MLANSDNELDNHPPSLRSVACLRVIASRWTDGDLAIATVLGAEGRRYDQYGGREPIIRRRGPVVA